MEQYPAKGRSTKVAMRKERKCSHSPLFALGRPRAVVYVRRSTGPVKVARASVERLPYTTRGGWTYGRGRWSLWGEGGRGEGWGGFIASFGGEAAKPHRWMVDVGLAYNADIEWSTGTSFH